MDYKKQRERKFINREGAPTNIVIDNDQVKKRLKLDSDLPAERSRSSSRNTPSTSKQIESKKRRSYRNRHDSRSPTPETSTRSEINRANTSIEQRVAGYSKLNELRDLRDTITAKRTDNAVENHSFIDLLDGTIVDFNETYGFILAEATAVQEVYNVTENGSGRLFFKISPQLIGTPLGMFNVNDLVTFSLKTYNAGQEVLDGHPRYEVTNVSLIFKRTDDQIYTVSSRKRKFSSIDNASSSAGSEDTKRPRKSAPRLRISGKVISWNFEKQFCFVQPLSKLPEGLFKPDNFFLHLSNLAAFELSLVFGDNVEIFVNPEQGEKMRADRGLLTSLTPKGHSNVNKIVYETLLFLSKVDSDQNFLVSQLYDSKPLLALFKYLLKIRGLKHVEEMNALFLIVRVLQICTTRCSNQFSKEVLCSAMEIGLFNKDGLFYKLLVSDPRPLLKLSEAFSENSPYEIEYDQQTSPVDVQQVFKILLKCVELFPDCSRKIHNLIAPRVSACGSEILLGLVRILSQPYAKRADVLHRQVKLVPTSEELQQFILSEEGHLKLSNLRPVIERGPYETTESYIETYFNLLRFDCFYNFLVGLKKYVKGNHDSRDINVYKNGSLVGIGLDKQSAAITFTVATVLETKVAPDKVNIERLVYSALVLCLQVPPGRTCFL